ncbi:UNVERIFIED_CONTAM: hypothetical protein HDU68_005591 [Siphonaria sp. JEL0065]|nr:hypothetical protein HDU68_005591 [Siphonaria sp. JEL0065]
MIWKASTGSSVAQCIQALSASPSPSLSLLFVAADQPLSNLKDIVRHHYHALNVPCIGAVVSTLGHSRNRVAVANLYSAGSCSSWSIDKSFSSHSPFRRNKPVGRWFEPLSLKDAQAGHHFNVSQFKSVSLNTLSLDSFDSLDDGSLDDASFKLRDLVVLPETDPSLILTISDRDPHAIWSALGKEFPTANKMGLIAPMTPFITGKTHTLFHNGNVIDSGLVGLSILSPKSSEPAFSYNKLTPVGDFMEITSCQGNIILTLDNSSATTQILGSLAKQFDGLASVNSLQNTISHDNALYLEVERVYGSNQKRNLQNCVYKIVAGDLRKGNIAVETIEDLSVGQRVRFMYQKKDSSDLTGDEMPPGLWFTTTKEAEYVFESEQKILFEPVNVEETLVVGSDSGIVHEAGSDEHLQKKVPISHLLENNATLLLAICHVPFVGEKASLIANGVLALLSFCRDASGSINSEDCNSTNTSHISCEELFLKRLLAIKIVQFEHKEKDLNDILRDNSLTTLLLTTFIRQMGAHFLHKTIPPTLEAMFPLLQHCEMDPMKLKHVINSPPPTSSLSDSSTLPDQTNDSLQAEISKNQVNLTTVCTSILDVFIENAIDTTPGKKPKQSLQQQQIRQDEIPDSVKRLCRFLKDGIERSLDLSQCLKPPLPPPPTTALSLSWQQNGGSIAPTSQQQSSQLPYKSAAYSPSSSTYSTPRKRSVASLHLLADPLQHQPQQRINFWSTVGFNNSSMSLETAAGSGGSGGGGGGASQKGSSIAGGIGGGGGGGGGTNTNTTTCGIVGTIRTRSSTRSGSHHFFEPSYKSQSALSVAGSGSSIRSGISATGGSGGGGVANGGAHVFAKSAGEIPEVGSSNNVDKGVGSGSGGLHIVTAGGSGAVSPENGVSRSPSTKSQTKSDAGASSTKSQKGLSTFNRKFWQVFGGKSETDAANSGGGDKSTSSSKRCSVERIAEVGSNTVGSGGRRGRTASAPLLDDLPTNPTTKPGVEEGTQSVTMIGPETALNSASSIANVDDEFGLKRSAQIQAQRASFTQDKLSETSLQNLRMSPTSSKKVFPPTSDETPSTSPPIIQTATLAPKSNPFPRRTSALLQHNNNLQINIISATPSSLDYAFLKRCELDGVETEQKQFAEARGSYAKLEEGQESSEGMANGAMEPIDSHDSKKNSVATLPPVPQTIPNTTVIAPKSNRKSTRSSLQTNSIRRKQSTISQHGPLDTEGRLTLIEKVIGSLLFLRYLVPSIITPDVIPPTPAHRRGLILAGKVLTAASNGVEFGIKEDYMMPLNILLLNKEPTHLDVPVPSLSRTQSQKSSGGGAEKRRGSTPVPTNFGGSAASVIGNGNSGNNNNGTVVKSNGFAKRASLPSSRMFSGARKSATKLLTTATDTKQVSSGSSTAISKLMDMFSSTTSGGGGNNGGINNTSATAITNHQGGGDSKNTLKTQRGKTTLTTTNGCKTTPALNNKDTKMKAIHLFFVTIASEMPIIAAEIAAASASHHNPNNNKSVDHDAGGEDTVHHSYHHATLWLFDDTLALGASFAGLREWSLKKFPQSSDKDRGEAGQQPTQQTSGLMRLLGGWMGSQNSGE